MSARCAAPGARCADASGLGALRSLVARVAQ
ncbi:hypothetical protein A2U01_0118711, partial [Trifolium medium]|nr:hypothetical protein [Trifolium medium]